MIRRCSAGGNHRPTLACAAVAVLVAAGCGDDAPLGASTVEVTLEPVGVFDEPVALVAVPGDDLLWVAQRSGRLVRVDPETFAVVDTVLDISADTEAAGERGLLGLAVDDDWAYINYTDRSGDTQVEAIARSDSGLEDTRRTLLSQPQPFTNHNGGALALDASGDLYIGFGDGGSADDPLDSGQDTSTLLGAVLRITPTPSDPYEAYRIPADNPFADGVDGRPEIYLWGVRNPWRFSFDPASGDLWLADVGQNLYEEVNHLPASTGAGLGANLGWRLREGTHEFTGDRPPGAIDPVWEYGRDRGCSVTGGHVYRGSAIPELVGAYVLGDYCTARLWSIRVTGDVVEVDDLGVAVPGEQLAAFGVDADGEIYALSLSGQISRLGRP